MTLEEKYGIVYVDGKRYYKFDMAEKMPFLDDTVPYMFEYKNIKIIESTWNKMTLRILEEIDKLNPKSNDELLALSVDWSKQSVFSETPKINHTKFRNIYLNTNHSSSHAMRNIQFILQTYGINLNDCYFLIKRHFNCEPIEVKQHINIQNSIGFRKSLALKKISNNNIEKILSNFEIINKYLNKVSPSYNDFLLFDDYNYFINYKIRVLDYVKENINKIGTKNYIIFVRCLEALDDYYKNVNFYKWIFSNDISQELLDLIDNEMTNLFKILNTKIIVINKLYARMLFMHKTQLEELKDKNNIKDFYTLCSIFFYTKYYFKEPYISIDKISKLSNDQIVLSYAYSHSLFHISDMNSYIEKMHLKKPDSYIDFIKNCSDDYVWIDFDTLLSKESFGVNETTINDIKKELNFYINSFGNLNSEKYNGYSSLPLLNYKWNKYLLIGIIWSFFSNDFECQILSKRYTSFSYSICANKH